jgi:hypothetical protein
MLTLQRLQTRQLQGLRLLLPPTRLQRLLYRREKIPHSQQQLLLLLLRVPEWQLQLQRLRQQMKQRLLQQMPLQAALQLKKLLLQRLLPLRLPLRQLLPPMLQPVMHQLRRRLKQRLPRLRLQTIPWWQQRLLLKRQLMWHLL